MFKHDGEEEIFGLIIAFVVVAVIIYIIVLLATIIVGAAAAGGTIYGGGYAIKNYVSSFKENVIDSNRASAMAA
ncbi:MAG: hypothetical protein HDR18_00065 [Lachnospiraceae bacterium]|nr:hypothetical protein [Lachnospiraceae bacterium]